MLHPVWLDPDDKSYHFPDPEYALTDPDGLLAVGGDLSSKRLLAAYRQGVFPWYSEGQPILWWSPNPRCVLYPDEFHTSRSLRRAIKKAPFRISFDQAFAEVICACANTERPEQDGTWITQEMADAYYALHKMGHAHSVEAWQDGELVGGLYGVAIGRVFFGESMFSLRTDASKIAFSHLLVSLKKWNYALVDCQVSSSHLKRFGAKEIERQHFIEALNRHCGESPAEQAWRTGPLDAYDTLAMIRSLATP